MAPRIFAILFLTITLAGKAQDPISVIDSSRFEVAGSFLDSELEYLKLANDPALYNRFLSVHLVSKEGKVSEQHILGRYQIKGDKVHFVSSSSPSFGLTFEVHLISRGQEFRKKFLSPSKPVDWNNPPELIGHYPRVDTIPENTLLFYFQFDRQMNPVVFRHQEVRLLDEHNKERLMPWKHKVGWSRDGTIAAVMVHPGRIKRDIEFMEKYGAVFYPGERVKIVLNQGFMGMNGEWNVTSDTIYYHIAKADTILPEVAHFADHSLMPGSKEAVILEFSETMCYGSFIQNAKVLHAQGGIVAGVFSVEKGEKKWTFIPDQPWQEGKYILDIPGITADLALNRLYRPFESTDESKIGIAVESRQLYFRVE